MYRIDAALAISLIIGTALQVLMFVSSLILRHKSNIALDKAQEMTEQANGIAADAERIHGGAMMCLEMSNELFYCHTSDERANIVIKWMPKLQESGIDVTDIFKSINN